MMLLAKLLQMLSKLGKHKDFCKALNKSINLLYLVFTLINGPTILSVSLIFEDILLHIQILPARLATASQPAQFAYLSKKFCHLQTN